MKPGSKKWKMFMAKLYGFGAAVVIIGAMFKIMHWPGAGAMLVIGLSTEALIFIFSAFEPLHEDPKWELVYPELALGHDEEVDEHALEEMRKKNDGSIGDKLDELFEEAKIDSNLIGKLGDGMRALADDTNKMKDVTGAVAATEAYSTSLQEASSRVSQLSDTYERAAEALVGITSSAEEGSSFGEQMQNVSKNLSALNNVYELQLKGSSQHLEATEKFYSQVTEMMQHLSDSVEDTRLYKENMSMLSRNLTDLNQVYGNMLKAMTITRD